jgi:hypothetical protein
MSTSDKSDNEFSPYFISHSGRDRERIVKTILNVFRFDGRREPRIMDSDELLRNPQPHWLQIKHSILMSDAVFLILSGGIIRQEHTQNWVAFEVGVAAGCDPPKPVIVIKGEDVEMPIPYLNHYYSYSPTSPAPHWNESDKEERENRFTNLIRPILGNPNHKPTFPQTTCSHCRLCYYYHGYEQVYRCPSCSNETRHWRAYESSDR